MATPYEERCEQKYEVAHELYLEGDFTGALGELADCYYRDDLPDELSMSIFRLVALVHLNRDDLDSARRAVLRMLSVDPGYRADPVQDPPSYGSMVNIVREQVRAGELVVPEVAEEPPNRDWVFVVGGGVLTVAIATLVAVMADRNGGAAADIHVWPPDKR